MSAIIEAQGLSKWFGEVVAVNNLDVSIEPGVTGLLGPNGAGKSTFIKLALGLYSPSRGTMSVFGEPPRNNLRVLRRIGYCPEFDRFPENTTGYEFVYWLNRFYGMTGAEATRRAEEACERVKMTDRMDDLIETYSRGMRQRIKIAQALAPSPELLFLDEPMAGLDPEGREEMFALIRELGENGRAVIVSSHILYEIERVTSHVVLLHNGCILARGRVHDMRELIDEHPLAVTVGCGSPRDLARHFAEDGATLSIEFEDGRVTVRTRDPNGFFEKLNRLVADKAVDVTSFACADADLQSVFQYLVR
ncbi:MAG TPA: ABC transporter ATP-binding protein [Candidatus Hydrogenedentes bacterium]|nr:ABC transporter ATP-binding protein [Candidatus Hydrogenedentota bacterium]